MSCRSVKELILIAKVQSLAFGLDAVLGIARAVLYSMCQLYVRNCAT